MNFVWDKIRRFLKKLLSLFTEKIVKEKDEQIKKLQAERTAKNKFIADMKRTMRKKLSEKNDEIEKLKCEKAEMGKKIERLQKASKKQKNHLRDSIQANDLSMMLTQNRMSSPGYIAIGNIL